MADYITITDLTREFGLTTRTLRFYEDEGLLSPQRRGRQRLYRPSDRTRLKLIMRGKRLGFSLSEISEIVEMYRKPPGEAGQLDLLLSTIDDRRRDLRQRQRDIEEILTELDDVESSCLARLDEIGKKSNET
ncbi:MAG: MerR family DNA-binding transcriptional regulator [Cohaesibacteraceae bacterium]|nr:MerR family DNA-binding transcriptional regulator [Cohaesibacteraceae bacterium]MBL4875136.1 MerR family DNA-binding transcriptional regulator [Cohaesibacteraceae bacterium]